MQHKLFAISALGQKNPDIMRTLVFEVAISCRSPIPGFENREIRLGVRRT